MQKIELNLSNYYGCVEAFHDGEKYWMELENYSGIDKVEISEQLWIALSIEFGVIEC